jgi:AcrR family transcriptional regulator
LDVFVERGLDGAGIEQVAKRAGVARTTVYRRWDSKESLIAEAIAQGRGGADETVLRNPISPHGRVTEVVNVLAKMVSSAEYRRIVARLIGSIPDCPQLMAAYWHAYLAPRRRVEANALERARAEGLLREDADAELLLDVIGGSVMYRLLIHPGDSSEKDIRSYLRRIMRQLGLENAKVLAGESSERGSN